ncbi:hypothetical protein EDB84DRAFT_251796 [Lactarius hengduanensis]|nr:hypothetical protein EDB84DRAFT_1084620 [Lactarius hengduanensis]KAH9029120.1 hypothetical protein EDB84DRAFT_251796 [Lactarius hengduanensis]
MRGLSNSTIALLQMWQPSQSSLVSFQPAPRSASAALCSRHTARTDALYEVGDPWLPMHVLLSTPLLAPVLMCALLHFGHGVHLSKDKAAELVKSWLKHRGVSSISMTHGTDGHRRARFSGRQAPRRIVPALPAHWYELDHAPHSRLVRTARGAACAHTTVARTTHFAPPRVLRWTTHKRSSEEVVAIANAALSSRDGEITPADLP